MNLLLNSHRVVAFSWLPTLVCIDTVEEGRFSLSGEHLLYLFCSALGLLSVTGSSVFSSVLRPFPTALSSALEDVKLPRLRIWSFGRKPFRVGDLSGVFASWSAEQRNQTDSWWILKCSFLPLQKLRF